MRALSFIGLLLLGCVSGGCTRANPYEVATEAASATDLKGAAPADFAASASVDVTDLASSIFPRDFSVAPDLSTPPALVGISCGNLTCVGNDPVCCSDDDGDDGACVNEASTCASNSYACDGPEDCGNGDICCGNSGGSACASQTACLEGGNDSHRVCHVDTDCAGLFTSCCPDGTGSRYKRCQAQHC